MPDTWAEMYRQACAVTGSPGRWDLPPGAVAKANATSYLLPGHSLSGFCPGPTLHFQGSDNHMNHFEGVSGQTGDEVWQIPTLSHGIITTSMSHSRQEPAACPCRQRCLGGVGVDSKDSSSEAADVTSAVRELPVTPLPCCCHTPSCHPPQRCAFLEEAKMHLNNYVSSSQWAHMLPLQSLVPFASHLGKKGFPWKPFFQVCCLHFSHYK